jgi:hypothetical protein
MFIFPREKPLQINAKKLPNYKIKKYFFKTSCELTAKK